MLWHMLQTQSRPVPVWLTLVCCCVWLYSNEIESPSSRSMYLPSASMTACAASVFSNSYSLYSPVRKLRPWCVWLTWQGVQLEIRQCSDLRMSGPLQSLVR